MTVPKVWLVSVAPDGRVAASSHEHIVIDRDATSTELFRLARPTEHRAGGLAELRRSMKASLVGAGLFDDEAEAMLETWRDSYFKTPGLRAFYIVPRDWIEYFLPLQISAPHALARALVGRIDFVER